MDRTFDLPLRNGRVIDPPPGFNCIVDAVIIGSRIVVLEHAIPPETADSADSAAEVSEPES